MRGKLFCELRGALRHVNLFVGLARLICCQLKKRCRKSPFARKRYLGPMNFSRRGKRFGFAKCLDFVLNGCSFVFEHGKDGLDYILAKRERELAGSRSCSAELNITSSISQGQPVCSL